MRKYNPKIAEKARRLIAAFIVERRKDLGWSQRQLAERANLRKATVVDVEQGRPHNLDTLLAILGSMRGELKIEWHDIDSMRHFGKPHEN